MILTTTAFAEEVSEPVAEPTDEPYIYTSEDFKYTIACPLKPLAHVRPHWFESGQEGEMLIFAHEGFNVQYAYVIQVNAFEGQEFPDFNKADQKTLEEYLAKLKENNPYYARVELIPVSKDNKGIFVVTAKEFEVINKETGEVDGTAVADREQVFTYFRTPQGRCVSVQLINENPESQDLFNLYRYSIASFTDNTEVAKSDKKDKKDKKSKKDKEKKSKKDKKDKDKK